MFFFSASLLDILSSSSKLPFTCWENRSGENQIKFTGTPYLFLRNCQFQCHQGSDKDISKKVKFRETQKEKLTGDHAEPIKTKKNSLTQLSKNVSCPVTLAVKNIYYFPEHKISADTKRQRTNVSVKFIFYLTYSNLAKKRSPEILSYLDSYITSYVFLQVGEMFR